MLYLASQFLWFLVAAFVARHRHGLGQRRWRQGAALGRCRCLGRRPLGSRRGADLAAVCEWRSRAMGRVGAAFRCGLFRRLRAGELRSRRRHVGAARRSRRAGPRRRHASGSSSRDGGKPCRRSTLPAVEGEADLPGSARPVSSRLRATTARSAGQVTALTETASTASVRRACSTRRVATRRMI